LPRFFPYNRFSPVGHRSSCYGPRDALPLLHERNEYPTAVSGLSVPEISTAAFDTTDVTSVTRRIAWGAAGAPGGRGTAQALV